MSQPAPKRRGRPKKPVASEEERLARSRALQRERSRRYYRRQHEQAVESTRAQTESQGATFIYHYQPHPPAIPSTTDPIVGLHLEPHLEIPTPIEPGPQLRIEPTYNRDYDEPSGLEAGLAAPPVWNHDENSRANLLNLVDATGSPPLFEDSQAQLELLSQGCDAADTALVQDQTSPSQLETRDEELQQLVDKVQQLLITPDGRIAAGKNEHAWGSSLFHSKHTNGLPDTTELPRSPTASSFGPQAGLTEWSPRSAASTQVSRASRTSRTSNALPQVRTPSQARRASDQSDCRGQRNTLHTWLRTPTHASNSPPDLTKTKTHDHDGYLLSLAENAIAFVQDHPAFAARPRQSPRHFGVEWSYHGLYAWNLRRRLERQDYLVTEDVLCGIRLAIELSGRQDVMTLVRTIQLDAPDAIQLSQAEIEDMRQHANTIIPIFHPGIDNTIGHWSLAIYQKLKSRFLVFDSFHPDRSCYSTLQDIYTLVGQDPAQVLIHDVPTTHQVYGWTCGLIAIECARCFLTVQDWVLDGCNGESLPFSQLDWTQQEPYMSDVQDPELREVSAISYWIEVISQYLGVISPSSNIVAATIDDRPVDPPPRSETLEAVADDVSGVIEPADPAVLLFQEWNGMAGCTRQQHEDDHSAQIDKATEERGTLPTCSSLLDIAKRLEGVALSDDANETRLPSVLDPAHDLLQPGSRESQSENGPTHFSASCKIAMEGAGDDEPNPPYLCMHTHHRSPRPERDSIASSYDVDSLCSFPTSLGVARLGLQWYTQPHATLNLVDNVHLSIDIPPPDGKGDAVSTQPLHNIPNYCLGRVVGLADTYVWAFFPALFRGQLSNPYAQTCIPRDKFVHWYEQVTLPAMQAVIDDNNILQYIPKTHAIASSDSSAPREALVAKAVVEEEEAEMEDELGGFVGAKGREGPVNSSGPHRKHFYVTIQARYLAALWAEMLVRAAPFPQYAGLRLYMAAKNTKLTWMRPTLESTLEEWRHQWDSAVDETYIDPTVTYIDIGRQLTPTETGPRGRVLLWRRCCLDRLWRRRLQWSQLQNRLYLGEEDGEPGTSRRRRSLPIRRTTYPFVTLRDARDVTITPRQESWELQNGLVYSQFYNLIKVPFDATKQYPFQNRHTESMALDPSYLLDQRNSTRGAHAHQSRVQCAYRLSKLRVHRNLPEVDHGAEDSCERSPLGLTPHQFTYGIRAEDRVSLALLRRIMDLFSSAPGQQSVEISEDNLDGPFFAVPSQTMARFLRASINRYCFLFEHVKAQTGLKYSLPETIVMATALRGLRFSYDSSLINSEPVLWGDRWTSTQYMRTQEGEQQTVEVQREGLGMAKTSKAHGFGWWLPEKFDWNTWRFASEVGDRLAVGNDLLRQDYKRQWRVLKDIRDVHVRMWQAQNWTGRYQVRDNVMARRLWLEYLHSTVIELFQRDVWCAALKSTKWKTGSDVTDEAVIRYPGPSPPTFCYDEMSSLFHDRQYDVHHTRPHLITGNKLRSTSVIDLVDDLFSPAFRGTAMKRRSGWSSLPYRIATRRSMELIEMTLGSAVVAQWYAQLRRLVLLTHWILPWPSDSELLTTTKESQRANLKRRLTWASIIHATPQDQLTPFSEPLVPTRKIDDPDCRISTQHDLSQALSEICRKRFGDKGWETSIDNANGRYHWSTRDLIKSTRDCINLKVLQIGRAVEPFNGGWIFPVAETGHPPQLRMIERIRDKTLDELDRLFNELLQTSGINSPSQSLTPDSRLSENNAMYSSSALAQILPRPYYSRRMGPIKRTAEEKMRLQRHFEQYSGVKARRMIKTASISSEEQTDGTDDLWRPPKRLQRAIRE